MDNKAIRLENMELLFREYSGKHATASYKPTWRDFAAHCGEVNPDYLSQLRSVTEGRGMGDDVARRLEVGMGKYTGWMDERHTGLRQEGVRVGKRFQDLSNQGQLKLLSFLSHVESEELDQDQSNGPSVASIPKATP
jgi:hypothetical protein